jgi:adenylate cyclase
MGERNRLPLALKLQRRASLAGFAVNAAGAASLGLYMLVVFPPEGTSVWLTRERGLGAVALYTVLAGLTAHRRARPWFEQMREWLSAGRPPTPEECRAVLRIPSRFAWMTLLRWALAVPLFAVPDLTSSWGFAVEVAVATALAGLSATAAVYLATEWVLRPAFALALAPEAPPDARSLGIGPRLLLTWILCSGVPIVMLALVPVARDVEDPKDLIPPTLFAAAMALITGFVATKLATQTVTRPIRTMRRAVDAVADGRLTAVVQVDDGSEIGRLQAGFNAMVAGLRERERLRDLYGRQVGDDVARAALEEGWELGGRRRELSALYVDVIGSTTLAERESPERVVALLNDFFAAVVAVVDERCGLVNKFEGDAALCVFGAPADQPDHADRALAAARALRDRVRALDGGLDAAIGVATGTAVAGYIGAETRFEYTVIGDPVNEAARLSEAAKERPERLLAAAATLEASGRSEAARWLLDGEVTLRGRRTPTRLARPVRDGYNDAHGAHLVVPRAR